jgi:UDP-N-acetylmuramate dehydrogenase
MQPPFPHQLDKRLSEVTTFGIGGPARLFAEVTTVEQMQELLLYAHTQNLPVFILGKGSNSLFDDRGFDGLVIHNKIAFCHFLDGHKIHVGAGYNFSLLGVQTARKHLSGLEFASGIPASVGGAVFMNAGANGTETCQALTHVEYVTEKGELKTFAKEELAFSYRHSPFQEMKGAIVGAHFQLSESREARPKQLQIVEYRTRTQPYGEKSAGCVFRNPTGHSAGALIEKSGLKGHTIGGAQVSPLHANFLINTGTATAGDILALAAHVKQQVKEKMGVDLDLEIRCINYVPS